MTTYKDIIRDILDDIASDKLKVNEKLPSEQGISIKYGVSRIVASNVFGFLRKIGAIYTIPKKGNYVAKYFQGLIKPIGFDYNITKMEDSEMEDYSPDFFKENQGYGNFKVFKRNYFSNDELIIESENGVDQFIPIDEQTPIIDAAMKATNVVSSIIFAKFEKFHKNDVVDSLVKYRVIYATEGTVCVNRFKIKPSEFMLIKQEFVL